MLIRPVVLFFGLFTFVKTTLDCSHRKLHRAVAFLTSKTLATAFAGWLSFTACAAEKKVLIARAFQKWQSKLLSRAWAAWQDMRLERQLHRHLLQHAITRLKNLRLALSWRRWQEVRRQRCFCLTRNISQITPKIIEFYSTFL